MIDSPMILWRTIDSVPRDATMVLLAQWGNMTFNKIKQPRWNYWFDRWEMQSFKRHDWATPRVRPTHWALITPPIWEETT